MVLAKTYPEMSLFVYILARYGRKKPERCYPEICYFYLEKNPYYRQQFFYKNINLLSLNINHIVLSKNNFTLKEQITFDQLKSPS